MAKKPDPNAMLPVKNTGKTVMYVASQMIHPGETRHFARHHVPRHLLPEEAPAAEEAAAADPVAELMELNANEIKAGLPVLPDEQLADVLELEMNGKKRKGIIEAVQNLQLERLAEKESQETFLKQDAEAIVGSSELETMRPDQLQALRELEACENGQQREEVLAAIDGLLSA